MGALSASGLMTSTVLPDALFSTSPGLIAGRQEVPGDRDHADDADGPSAPQRAHGARDSRTAAMSALCGSISVRA